MKKLRRLSERRVGNNTIRGFEEMRAQMKVVYHGDGQAALRDAYRLLAQIFREAKQAAEREAGEAK